MNSRSDAGVTMPELLVTVLIFSIISIVLFGFINHVTEVATRAEAHERAEKEALLVLRTLTQDLRAAADIEANPGAGAGATCPAGGVYTSPYAGFGRCVKIVINEPTDGVATCPRTEARYGLATDGSLRQDRVVYRVVGATCTATSTTTAKVLMTDITNTRVFTFLDNVGKDVTTYATPVSPVNAESIRVDLLKQFRKNAPPIDLTSTVSLRNKR